MYISNLMRTSIFIAIMLMPTLGFSGEREAGWDAADLKARSALDRGDLAEARRAAEDAARIAESTLGAKQMKTAVAYRKLAELERLNGSPAQAARTLERASGNWQSVLGEKNPYVADLKLQIARDHETAEDWTGAEAAAGEAVRIRKAYFGPDHTAVADALQQAARIGRKAGHSDTADRDEAEAADILLKALGGAHPRALAAFASLADHAVERGDLPAARRGLGRVLAAAGAGPHPDPKAIARVRILHADLAVQDHDPVAAEASYDRALELWEQAGEGARSERLSALYKLREFYQGAGREEDALRIDERARDLERTAAPPVK